MIWRMRRVLVLAPHTDDAEFGAGGFISRLIEEKTDVYIVAFSNAKESLPDGFPKDTLIHEMQEATKRLGVPRENISILDYPVRRFPQFRQEILDDLIKLRKNIKPDMVLVHSSADIHQDHHTVYNEAVRAYKGLTILGYELPWNTFVSYQQLVIALNKRHIENKIYALQAYISQKHRPYANEEFIKGWAMCRGMSIGESYAESFEVIRWVIR